MEPRIIKSEEQYRETLAQVERLAALDPEPESANGARLELLAKLVEDYEKERFKIRRPDPVEAIQFRMEEQGLRQKDLAEILGGKNRASEVLARKRPLTLPMIRALYEKLAIPPEVLIREPSLDSRADLEVKVSDQTAALMLKRGWVSTSDAVSQYVRNLFAPTGSPAFLKNTITYGANARTNRTHVWLWLARVRHLAAGRAHLQGRFRRSELNMDTLQYVAKLSWMSNGPRLAKDFLEERGIAVVLEPHLPSTHIDGAALVGSNGVPIVALSLREDRLDNFWFTLLHELVHIWKHVDSEKNRAIADENIERIGDTDKVEREANDIAADALLPRAAWRRSAAYANPTNENIASLAAEHQINPAIVAGRVRFERKNYALFSKLVGYRQVKLLFPEVRWQ